MPSFEKRKNGKWSVRFRTIDCGKEKQVRLSGFDTKREAELAYFTHKKNIEKLSFDFLLEKYISLKRASVKEASLYVIKTRLRPFNNLFKDKSISTVSALDIFEYVDKMQISNNYKNLIVSTLGSFYVFASKHFNVENVLKDSDIRWKSRTKEKEIWTSKEFLQFESVINNIRHKTLFRMLFLTGMRIGEASALTWEDIDLENKVISINKTVTLLGDISTPKSKTSNRTLAISQALVDSLFALKNALKPKSEKETVFFKRIQGWQVHFKKYINQSGVKEISMHSLRHSFASQLISLNVPIAAVSKYLGHASPAITLNTYTHFIKSDAQKVVLAIDKIGHNLVTN